MSDKRRFKPGLQSKTRTTSFLMTRSMMRKMISWSYNHSSLQMDLRKLKNLLSNRHQNHRLTKKQTRRIIIMTMITKTGRITMMNMIIKWWMTKSKMRIKGNTEKTIDKNITIMRNSMPMKKTIVSFMKILNSLPKSLCCQLMRRLNTSSKGNLAIAILGWFSIGPTGTQNSINGAKTS